MYFPALRWIPYSLEHPLWLIFPLWPGLSRKTHCSWNCSPLHPPPSSWNRSLWLHLTPQSRKMSPLAPRSCSMSPRPTPRHVVPASWWCIVFYSLHSTHDPTPHHSLVRVACMGFKMVGTSFPTVPELKIQCHTITPLSCFPTPDVRFDIICMWGGMWRREVVQQCQYVSCQIRERGVMVWHWIVDFGQCRQACAHLHTSMLIPGHIWLLTMLIPCRSHVASYRQIYTVEKPSPSWQLQRKVWHRHSWVVGFLVSGFPPRDRGPQLLMGWSHEKLKRVCTTCYHHGVVERFHWQLKSALKAQPNLSMWCYWGHKQPWRRMLDLCTAAELVYGTTLRYN